MQDDISIDARKAELRRESIADRDRIPADTRAKAAESIAARPFPLSVGAGTIVSGFFPLKTEINPLPLMRNLSHMVCRTLTFFCLTSNVA